MDDHKPPNIPMNRNSNNDRHPKTKTIGWTRQNTTLISCYSDDDGRKSLEEGHQTWKFKFY